MVQMIISVKPFDLEEVYARVVQLREHSKGKW